MNIKELKSNIQSGKYDKTFALLYDDVKAAQSRYLKAADEFVKLYGERDNIRIFSAPGRTEVGGNHTDHQHGRVLAGSVDLDVIAIVSPNDEGIVRIKSEGFKMDEVELSSLEIKENETGKAIALIRGMCNYFTELGFALSGFDAYTTSNVLKGSGLSSSAAFEVLIGNILNSMFCGEKVSRIDIAKISQKAESIYFGKPCGLLDQSASSLGGFTYIDFADPTNPKVESISFDLAEKGYALCVVNTGGNHSDLTKDYADITVECKAVSNFFGKEYLREVNPEDFFNNIAKVREKCGDRAVLRAFHFFREDARVDLEKSALESGDFGRFLHFITKSGNSSYKYLQNVYSNSAVDQQGLSLALAVTEEFVESTEGACRVHGGGFAGTIQAFLPTECIDAYKKQIESIFGSGSCYILKIRPVGGTEIKE